MPLDSRDAQRWLPFGTPEKASDAWFGSLPALACTLRWTEAPATHFWRGTPGSGGGLRPPNPNRGRWPCGSRRPTRSAAVEMVNCTLVEGMFCQVEIPGRILAGVFRLPRHVVSFENTVYVAEGNRLRTVDVTVARTQGEEALISEGLQAGQQVIVTRLVDPLENSLLTIETDGAS